MNEGFIYVLANSSMPDLVKVGLTTRKPSDRASELSGVTGVPTPFMVVYEIQVNDCVAAEKFIHEMLSQAGFRVSEAREFFKAPVRDVINVIMQLPVSMTYDVDSIPFSTHEVVLPDIGVLDELSSMKLSQKTILESQPWFQIYSEANSALYGYDDDIVDYPKALKLYGSAAKLGCNLAYHRIGDMYMYGLGAKKSMEKALEFFKESVRLKNYVGYIPMAYCFCNDNNLANAEKCLNLFFRDRQQFFSEALEEELDLFSEFLSLVRFNPELFKLSNTNLLTNLKTIKPELNEKCVELIERYAEDEDLREESEIYTLLLPFINSL